MGDSEANNSTTAENRAKVTAGRKSLNESFTESVILRTKVGKRLFRGFSEKAISAEAPPFPRAKIDKTIRNIL